MAGVLEQLQQMRCHEAPSPFHARQAICKVAVPVLLGLARAMGRFAPPSEDFLLAKILPRAGPGLGGPSGKAGASQEESVKGFSNFRSIIPRSLSSTFQSGSSLIASQSAESVVDLSFRPSLRSDLMCHQSERGHKAKQ